MNFSSILIENAVNEFAKLPGIGKRTALRMVLHLLKKDESEVVQFADRIKKMRLEIKFCKECHNVADDDLCSICLQHSRKKESICVVESIRELIAIESTQQFNGVYHVLGGLISPLDGIGPDQLTIDSLLRRMNKQETKELIFALSPTLEGDTTTYYIGKKTKSLTQQGSLRITTLSRGVAFGGELEYADEMTLAKSLQNRIPLEQVAKNYD